MFLSKEKTKNLSFSLRFVGRKRKWFKKSSSFFQGIGVRELGGQGGGEGWGPGSYPPRCTSKCGECSPCKPVHVPVPQGTPVITEYYPEAWRCKCNNKLYMP
ncbi:hypothetical protein HPP92_007314 [Vanilla planifolia]|uniref:Epidermal patterning factor-like protein n=1 Tax=Vanilla planifolia TaxID=51239 RepID=A0A835VBR4_VANPL|nr:hypothetical protein HPP92_007314 [Vanilla planifolia]